MSAVYAVKYSDRIEVLTDGARYLDDGRITEITSKIWQIGTLPMVFTGRGNTCVIEAVKACLNIISFGSTFDASIECFREMLEARQNQDINTTPIDGTIAGLSEMLGPVIYYFHTYREEGDYFQGLAPFVLHEIESEFAGGPAPSPRSMRDSGLPMFWALDDAAEYGVKFFEAMRRTPGRHLGHQDKPELYMVGGKVDHTIVTANGVTTACLHEWPDKVGQPIMP